MWLAKRVLHARLDILSAVVMPRRRPAGDPVSASPAKLPKPEVEGEELSNATIRQELIRLGQAPGPVDDGNRFGAKTLLACRLNVRTGSLLDLLCVWLLHVVLSFCSF